MKGRSTQDINVLGTQHIKEVLFFSLSLFEWDICYFFSLTVTLAKVVYNLTLYQLKPLLLDLSEMLLNSEYN